VSWKVLILLLSAGCSGQPLGQGWRLAPQLPRLAARTRIFHLPQNCLRPFSSLVHLGFVTLVPIAALVDEALLGQARTEDGLEALYRKYEAAIFTLGRRLCGNDQDADDLLQETFLEVNRSLGRFRGEGSLLGWIKKICVSKALMRMRRALRFAEESLDALQGTDLDCSHPFSGRLELEAALDQLSPTARVVVWLHDVEGYTHEEISELLDRSVSFSKSQLSRAHARLRQWLADRGDFE
jgi:RNA polymerase sigma-70 factor (ECF subfamily)